MAVASFGRFEVIHAYLERICPGVFSRANISTPSCVGVPDGCSVPQGKTPQLDALLAALLPGGRDAVLFLDDAKHNIDVRSCASLLHRTASHSLTPSCARQLARAAGYTRSFVIPKGGFTRAAWQAIASFSGEDAVIDIASL